MTDFRLGPGPLTPEFEQVKSDIGIVENSNTATHAIPAGYYVIWNGDLYIAKTDIPSGTALSAASGGNLTAKTQGLGGEIATLNSNIANVDNKIKGTAGTPPEQVQSFTFTDDNGAKIRMTIGKLDATHNYIQFWLGNNMTDRGYITFDVSRNIT